MSIAKIMCKDVVTVEMDDPLRVVKDIFDHATFHHLVVLDEYGKLCGVIAQGDLLKIMTPALGTDNETDKDRAVLNRRVHQVMTRHPITLSPQTGIYEAISLFNQKGYSCLPVVDDMNKPVGMLSWRDILKAIEKLHSPTAK